MTEPHAPDGTFPGPGPHPSSGASYPAGPGAWQAWSAPAAPVPGAYGPGDVEQFPPVAPGTLRADPGLDRYAQE